MTTPSYFDLLQFLCLVGLLLCLTPLLGSYMKRIFEGRSTFAQPLLGGLEKICYRISGVNRHQEMSWTHYTKALFLFNGLGFAVIFLLQVLQDFLPLNDQNVPGVSWLLALNTAMSFVTNTNWQAYSGETTLSYLTQMLGMAVQNFLSAATGMAVLIAFTRGIIRKTSDSIGNFWVDCVRTIVYLLLPLSTIMAIILVAEGSVQTFSPYAEIETFEKTRQTIPLGPVASQVAIKQLGTNGGGFFNANSAHPFENPTGFSNFVENLAILLIPAASVYMYGLMIGLRKQAWFLLFVMFILWIGGLALAYYADHLQNPILDAFPVWEGKEIRIGISNSSLWSISTTGTSNGSVNSMLSSAPPLVGGVAMFNIMLGELIFGGIGVGLCSMLMFVLLTVFLAGLMVGRTPEYLGKKIEKKEMQWVIISVLMPGALILIGAGISSILPSALSSVDNPGPHGLSEILYAFSSTAENNGSAFAGLNANTPYYNGVLTIVMLMGRISIIVPSLAVAGLLARKKITPTSAGTFSTETFLFIAMLISIILIVGALTFFPALSLGPLIEHFLMLKGQDF